ncbi:hypothetical protein [Flavobacterium nackdongense]|uniref:Uncharacterized protein n=1 Tax=Flavobacterium nackdongense TaxID=2547394 RepID=A0A4P6Y6B6_9FLAO|nr:hypothetical protein [Flavobacterium nackdongense]QBN17871.1 hypothetical protein E1750_03320 [Flavobacterium nackdongense]
MYNPKSILVKKHFFLLTLFYSLANAQVGIGTTSPNAQLDIESTTNGILIPRVALTSKATSGPIVNPNGGGAPADATLVYNTATAGSGTDAVTPGFYYYNAASSRWVQSNNLIPSSTNNIVTSATGIEVRRTALAGDITAGANSNTTTISPDAVTSPKILDNTIVNADLIDGTGGIYKGDGTLPAATTVNARIPVDSKMAFTPIGGAANQFSVDGSTFSIDTDKNFVGIGTQTPSYKLHVRGDTNIKGELRLESSASGSYAGFITGVEEVSGFTSLVIQSADAAPGAGIVFNTNSGGGGIIEAARFTNVGRLGLGTPSPTAQLHTTGTVRLETLTGTGNRMVIADANGNLAAQDITVGTVTNVTGTAPIASTGGATPVISLDDAGVTNTKLAGGAGGIYKGSGTTPASAVVASIPTGGTLAFTPSGTQVANQFSVDGTTFSVDALNNRVGVGIAAPTSTFHNNGTTSYTIGTSGTTNTVLLMNANFTIPDPSTCTGRMYIIRNTRSPINTITVSVSGTPSVFLALGSLTTATSLTIANAGTISLISNGTNWYQIN